MRTASNYQPTCPGIPGRLFPIVLILLSLAATGSAQYQMHHWTNFEDGTFGAGAIMIGAQTSNTLRVVEMSSVPGMPPEFYGSGPSGETGRYALEMTAAPEIGSMTTGLAIAAILDREQLGPEGRALCQADFYLGPEAEVPSLAVLAMAPPGGGKTPPPPSVPSPSKFYRFGFTLGKIPYFSYVVPEKDKPIMYQHDMPLLPEIPKPGWHRFTLMLIGNHQVACYIDGRKTAFPPLQDSTHPKMIVGVMLADSKRSYKCYVDNLSIQTSRGEAPLPESPYNAGWRLAAGDGPRLPADNSRAEAPRDTRWLEPLDAWKRARDQRVPLLLFFHSPGHAASERVNDMFDKNVNAGNFLKAHAASRIDINQLQGGTIAKEYGVFKVPTLLLISPDASAHRRVVPDKAAEWEAIAGQLKL